MTTLSMKRIALAAACLVAVLLTPAFSEEVDVAYPPSRLDQLRYRLVGVMSGATNGPAVEAAVGPVTVVYFPDLDRMLAALREGGVQAIVHESSCLEALVEKDPSYKLMKEPLRKEDYGLAVRLDNKDLAEALDAAIAGFKKDGTLERLKKKWIDGPAADKVLEAPTAKEGGGVIRYGVTAIGEPFVYRDKDNRLVGHDVELGYLVAAEMGKTARMEEMIYADLISSLTSDGSEMIGSALGITPERQELVRFSESYFQGGASILVMAE